MQHGSPSDAASTHETDKDLLAACRAGNADAWQRLVDRYERLIYAIPLRMGLTHADADEVFQDTFAALAQSLNAIRDERRLAGWLATVARRNAWHLLRAGKTESTFSELAASDERASGRSLLDAASALGAPDMSASESWELALWLDGGLRQLNARCRELLQALYLDPRQPGYAEIVATLGIPLGSIGPTRARCLEQLRRVLAPELP